MFNIIKDYGGIVSVEQFMQLALYHHSAGYYSAAKRNRFNTVGGLIALFLLTNGIRCFGNNASFNLCEVGAGSGIMMRDMLLMLEKQNLLGKIGKITICEVSEHLRTIQHTTLQSWIKKITWVDKINDISDDLPILLVANELLDATPIRQYQYADGNFYEVMVECGDGELNFVRDANNATAMVKKFCDEFSAPISNIKDGNIIEVPLFAINLFKEIRNKIQHTGGTMLFIDYGFADFGNGVSTLQAVYQHKKVDVLQNSGNADITHLVQFGLFKQLVEQCFFSTQRDFLLSLGIDKISNSTTYALNKLIALNEMGDFKVLSYDYVK
jgi:SAM-dependent MidA family methyltransferase